MRQESRPRGGPLNDSPDAVAASANAESTIAGGVASANAAGGLTTFENGALVRSSGFPLDANTRDDMEQRFGDDFSAVRVHTGSEATLLARTLNADAFTVGEDIVFSAGAYDVGTASGRALLAHELAHVVQRRSTKDSPDKLIDSGPDDPAERAATRAAEVALSTPHERVEQSVVDGNISVPSIQRQQAFQQPVSPAYEVGAQETAEESGLYLPEIKIAKEIPLTPEVELAEAGPVAVTLEGKADVEGALECGEAHSGITFAADETEFETELSNELNSVKLKAAVGPKESSVGIEWEKAGELMGRDVSLELKFDFAKMLENKAPIELEGEVPVLEREFVLAGCKFKGRLAVAIVVGLKPNWTFIAAGLGEAAVGVGEAAVAAAPVVLVAGFVAFIAYGLYETGKAHYEGRRQAIGNSFASGYSHMLALLTGPLPLNRQDSAELDDVLGLGWEAILSEKGAAYQRGDEIFGLNSVERAGKAAIAQQVLDYISDHGRDAWHARSMQFQQQYGQSEPLRRERFFMVLYQQVKDGSPVVGIAL
jgi:hypothetical protein